MKCRASSLAAVLLAVTPANVGAFVPSSAVSGSCFGGHACKVKTEELGYHDGPYRGSMLARRARRRKTMTAAQEESAGTSDESSGSGGSRKQEEEDDGEDAVWARAELPMSNDVQVAQATRAVWQVREGAPWNFATNSPFIATFPLYEGPTLQFFSNFITPAAPLPVFFTAFVGSL